jgi:sigma-B regulation protein RsbU (phosphoserine phosphatase)
VATRAAAEAAFQRALRDDDPAALYEQAPCGYLSTTPGGTILKANATFLTWTGYQLDELLGRRFVDLLTPGGRIYHETHYSPMLHTLAEVKEIAFEVVRADGGRLPVLINAVMDRSPDGEPRVARIAIFDATERRRYETELLLAKRRAEESEARAVRLASTLQNTLIPPQCPVIPHLDVAAEYRPAGNGDEVGGDFYDIFQLAEGDWVVALGDVSGKGVDAAVVTSLVRHTIRALAVRESAPDRLLAQLNDILLASSADRFCTVVVLRLHLQADGHWSLTTGSGGHPLPLMLGDGRPPRTLGTPGSLVGAFDSVSYEAATTTLEPGDKVLLYTDGVTEARRGNEFYGDERLLTLLRRDWPDCAELVHAVLDDVLTFQVQLPRDDIAVLALGLPR